MSDPACTIDVPVTVNRKAAVAQVTGSHVKLTFGKRETTEVLVDRANIQHTIYSADHEFLGLHLKNTQCIVPKTTKKVKSVVLAQMSTDDARKLFSEAVQATECTTTACGRTHVTHAPVLVAWSERSCTCVPDVDYVILQRTMGGMSTFDAHIVPKHDKIVTVEMLPHSSLDAWRERYGEKVIDLGPDPISNASLERIRNAPGGIAEAFTIAESNDDSGMSCSDDEEYNDEDNVCSSDDDVISVMSSGSNESSEESEQSCSSYVSEDEHDLSDCSEAACVSDEDSS